MISYLDTSFLMKLYVFESDSQLAADIVVRNRSEPLISYLSQVEMASALHARGARLPGNSSAVAYKRFLQNVDLYRSAPMSPEVFGLAQSLAEKHGAVFRVRALDVLHVAAAMNFGAEAFGTFDRQQAKLAEAVGLKVLA